MTQDLIVEEVLETGVQEVGRLQSGEVVIGREPADGISVPRTAISGEHGVFLRVRNHWFYKDLGSTNGSWINGKEVSANIWRLVRANDYVQLADVALRLRPSGEGEGGSEGLFGLGPNGNRSLIVFQNGKFTDEFPIPEFGKALVVGGSQGDLSILGDTYENPALVVEKRSDKVCAYSVAKEHEPVINEAPLSETVPIEDRDILGVADYSIIFNDPPPLGRSRGSERSAGDFGGGSRLESWGDEDQPSGTGLSRAPISSSFGRAVPDQSSQTPQTQQAPQEPGMAETVALSDDQFQAQMREHDPYATGDYPNEEHGYAFGTSEDRITLFVGIILLAVLLVLLVWWIFLI